MEQVCTYKNCCNTATVQCRGRAKLCDDHTAQWMRDVFLYNPVSILHNDKRDSDDTLNLIMTTVNSIDKVTTL